MPRDKHEGTELAFNAILGSDGTRHLVFRSLDGSFHVFTEVEANQAAREFGAAELANTWQTWEWL